MLPVKVFSPHLLYQYKEKPQNRNQESAHEPWYKLLAPPLYQHYDTWWKIVKGSLLSIISIPTSWYFCISVGRGGWLVPRKGDLEVYLTFFPLSPPFFSYFSVYYLDPANTLFIAPLTMLKWPYFLSSFVLAVIPGYIYIYILRFGARWLRWDTTWYICCIHLDYLIEHDHS